MTRDVCGVITMLMTPETAALIGDLDALVTACVSYPVLEPTATLNAALGGNVECLAFLHRLGAPWHPRTTVSAARVGSLACLEYAHTNGAPWHAHVSDVAARLGNLGCLQYCHENGAVWSWMTTHIAAIRANLECLRYAVEHGAPTHALVMQTCISNLVEAPNSSVRMDTLMYAVDAGLPYSARTDAAMRVDVFMSMRRRLHLIRVIQRAWRARPNLIRRRRLRKARERRAANVIQLAYLAWTCRPGAGRTYKRARSSFEDACASVG